MTFNKPLFAFPFSPHMPAFVTDYDVAMAYEFFLGRTPESASVIADHKQRRFDDLVTRFIHSDEFIDSTAHPLRTGESVARLDHTRGPNRSQTSWLLKNFVMDETAQQSLYGAGSWDKFFRILLVFDPQDAAAPTLPPAAPPPIPEPSPEDALAEAEAASLAALAPLPAFVPPIEQDRVRWATIMLGKLTQIEMLLSEIRELLDEN
jgi:hypothetical protein